MMPPTGTPGAAGRWMFAVAMAGFGAQFLMHAATARLPGPGGPWVALTPLETPLAGAALIAGAVGVAARWKTRWAAVLLALVFLRVLVVHFARLLANPSNPGPWTAGFEILGLSCVALVIMDDGESGRLTAAGRWLIAAALVVFGVQHFMYSRFVADFMPAWIPGRLFWAYAAAVGFFSAALCFIAATPSAAARRLAPLAATLLGVMFLLFLLSVHLFRIAAAPETVQEWTSGLVALGWSGGSWILAGAVGRSAETRPER